MKYKYYAYMVGAVILTATVYIISQALSPSSHNHSHELDYHESDDDEINDSYVGDLFRCGLSLSEIIDFDDNLSDRDWSDMG
jgi:hypothetical protein